jgi:hypothetical protein
MEAVAGYYDGNSFIPVKPVSARKNQRVIIILLDENDPSIEAMSELDGLYELLGTDSRF